VHDSGWSGWDVLVIALTFIVSDFVWTAVAAIYVARRYHEALQQLAADARVAVPAQVAAYLITLAVMYMVVTRLYGKPFWKGVKWVWPQRASGIARLFLLGILLALFIGFLETLLPMPSHVPFQRFFTTVGSAYIMGVLAVLLAPFMEELFFRGFLYPALRRWGVVLAVLLTSLAFAGVHGAQYGWAWAAVLLMFIVGLVLTLARAWSGSVAPGFLIHAAYNLTLFTMLYFSTDHFRQLERLGH
jgi:hypothetical protein